MIILIRTSQSDRHNPPTKTRAMVYEPEPEAEWTTQEIQISVR